MEYEILVKKFIFLPSLLVLFFSQDVTLGYRLTGLTHLQPAKSKIRPNRRYERSVAVLTGWCFSPEKIDIDDPIPPKIVRRTTFYLVN